MTDSAAPYESRARRVWLVTWVAYASYYFGRKGFSVVKKPLETALGLDRATLGAIETGYLALYSVGQLTSGVLADRLGARRLIGFGMLASAVLCAAFGASSLALAFGATFALNGLAQATGWPGAARAMSEWTTDTNRRRVMAVWSTCYQIGGLAATALASSLLVFGWRAAFIGPAAVMAVVGFAVLALLAPGPDAPEGEPRTRETAKAASDERWAAVRSALASPSLWCFGASYFGIKLIRYSLLFWLPYYLSDDLGYAPDRAGYLSTAFELGGAAGAVAFGFLTDRLRHVSRTVLSAAALLGLAAMLVLYGFLAPLGTFANAAGLALVGACLFGPDAVLSGAAAQDAGGPHAAATAAGLVNGIGSVGAVVQGALNAWVSRRFGWQAVFHLLVVMAVLSAVALAPTFRREARTLPQA